MSKEKASSSKVEENSVPFAGFSSSVNPSFSPIESLRYRDDGEGNFRFFSDLYFVLNMNRIVQTLGLDTARSIISAMNASSLHQSISPDIPDDQRLALVKSRFIQSTSEVSSWYYSLQKQLNSFKADYDALLSDIQQQQLKEAAKQLVTQQSSGGSNDSIGVN